MKNSQEMKELEAQIALDKRSYDEIDRAEAQLMENIPPQGFSAIPAELDYRGRKEELANSIRVGEERLAGMRSQPDYF
jgi:hypothetical protein